MYLWNEHVLHFRFINGANRFSVEFNELLVGEKNLNSGLKYLKVEIILLTHGPNLFNDTRNSARI